MSFSRNFRKNRDISPLRGITLGGIGAAGIVGIAGIVSFLGFLGVAQVGWTLPPLIDSAYGGGYYHYENASPAYRHGVKTPFNSYPHLPAIPTVPMPIIPVVPIPTMADLMPGTENVPRPYIGINGIGYYSDQVMAEYNPNLYRNPNPDHRNLHHRITDNPQEIPPAYQEGYYGAAQPGWNEEYPAERPESTDKPTKKSKRIKQPSKRYAAGKNSPTK